LVVVLIAGKRAGQFTPLLKLRKKNDKQILLF
jgi:hypothetical protein